MDTKYCLGHFRVRSSTLVSIRSMNIKYAIIISVGITWAKTKLCPPYVMYQFGVLPGSFSGQLGVPGAFSGQ